MIRLQITAFSAVICILSIAVTGGTQHYAAHVVNSVTLMLSENFESFTIWFGVSSEKNCFPLLPSTSLILNLDWEGNT